MARSKYCLGLLALSALLMAPPAHAQLFDSIFGNRPPPRPPADVPNAPPSQSEPPYYPSYPDRGAPPRQRADEPPPEPLPAPMSLPPQARPGGGNIESEPLAPIPGTEPKRQVTAPPTNAAPPNAALPPGQLRPGVPPPAANIAPQPGDQVVVEPPPQRITNPTAVFAGLDKITGRIISFDVAINETVQFGALQVTPRVCYSRPPTESPQTDSFVEVDEVTLQGEIKRIFTGWMFAASPGLHAVEHPIYDVWLTECKGGKNPAVAEAPPEAEPAKPPAAKPPAPARRQPAPRGALPPFR
jgi:hypothetical protein